MELTRGDAAGGSVEVVWHHEDFRTWPAIPTTVDAETVCGKLQDVQMFSLGPNDNRLILCNILFDRPVLDKSSPPGPFREPASQDQLGRKIYAGGRLLYAIMHLQNHFECV